MEFLRKHYCKGRIVSPRDLLNARERRALKQEEIRKTYEGVLVSFTLNIPGAIKVFEESVELFNVGVYLLESKLKNRGYSRLYCHTDIEDTGYVYYAIVDTDQAQAIKEICISLEENHEIGRVFDMDVISMTGLSMSRTELGYGKRKCLLCDEEGHACARNKSHTIGSLIDAIIIAHRNYVTQCKIETYAKMTGQVIMP